MTTKVDFIKSVKYSKEEFTGVCECCNRNLKKSFVCSINGTEITLGQNCLFGSKEKVSDYEKCLFFLEIKTSMWTKPYNANSDIQKEILIQKGLLK